MFEGKLTPHSKFKIYEICSHRRIRGLGGLVRQAASANAGKEGRKEGREGGREGGKGGREGQHVQ